MTETTARIRWTGDDDEAIGCVGTLNPAAFRIWEASEGGEWLLASILPGHQGARTYGDNPEKLKAEAERWLAGFVSSLGAVFPGSGEALVRIEEEERPAAFFDEHDLTAIKAAADPGTTAATAEEKE